MSFRNVTDSECQVLRALVDVVPECGVSAEWFRTILVEPMDDGGMGSLRLGSRSGQPLRPIAELQFGDVDGVLVIATLYVGDDNVPHELGMWKVDFTPLIQIPTHLPAAERYACGDDPQ